MKVTIYAELDDEAWGFSNLIGDCLEDGCTDKEIHEAVIDLIMEDPACLFEAATFDFKWTEAEIANKELFNE